MEGRETPTVSILLLGDSGCGKTTFLSYVRNNQTIGTEPLRHPSIPPFFSIC